MNIIVSLYKLSKKLKKKIIPAWVSYTSGLSIEILSNASSISDFVQKMTNLQKPSVWIMWLWLLFVILTYIINSTFDKISFSNKADILFQKIMQSHTCRMLNEADCPGYSWGYNKNIVFPRNPEGWLPENIYIDLKNSSIDYSYRFPNTNEALPGYTADEFNKYCDTEKVQTIRRRGDDHARYGVTHIEKSNEKNADRQQIEIRLRKTSWTQLQFSWDYLRRLDVRNQAVPATAHDTAIEKQYQSVLKHEKDSLLINSFSLHLIMVSSSGNVILSRISNVKSNDYPRTWAATIGEQLEKEDFMDVSTRKPRNNFVANWVKRALKEEFDIDENELTERGENELEEYVDMHSLRVLSIDLEADIYNIALTCIVRLKINTDELLSLKGIVIDNNENTRELREVSIDEARSILMNYPENSSEYHPSTYLRLLMYHLYADTENGTKSAFAKNYKRK